ncbi:VWA domain-containing protein [Fictibacillus nanhaiensis]|uniref:VWA domain-containing protein n=1 Tax=Fictibacillus nanhaiensis TaxID=742169 RepID=A0ABS2ZJJ8_9BACL|nr:VWA domain-containing protein [Fictibacillus nanhaiensis]
MLLKQTRYLLVVIFLLLVVLVVGCSNKESSTNGDNQEKAQNNEQKDKEPPKKDKSEEKELNTDVTPLPTSTNEIFTYPNGDLAGTSLYGSDETQKQLLKTMPKLPKNADKETVDLYFNNLVALYWSGFDDPATLVDKWELYSFGSPDIEDQRYQFKENYNVEIVLDASGSMAKTVNGKTQMELAKSAINNFLGALPDNAKVGLRVYGHKGSGSDSDKKLSCSSSDLVYEVAQYDSSKFKQALDPIQPVGWTPITLALEEAQKDLLKYPAENNNNIVFLVSDGIETCDGDPVAAAKKLSDSNISPILNVIGFNVDAEGQKQLKEVAKAADGIYSDISDQKQLDNEFKRIEEIAKRWEQWKKDSLREADAVKVERSFEALGFKNEWNDKEITLTNNLGGSITFLANSDYITKEQREALREKKNEFETFLDESGTEVEEYLSTMNEKSFEEMKKSINEKYNKN